MSIDLEQRLGRFRPRSWTARLVKRVMDAVPGDQSISGWTHLADGLQVMDPDASTTVLERARAHALEPDAQRALQVVRLVDLADTGIGMVSLLRSVFRLFRAKGGEERLEALENDSEQAADAAVKALALGFLVVTLFPGSPTERVKAFHRTEAGRALLAYFAAVELGLPFMDNMAEAAGAALRRILDRFGMQQNEQLAAMAGDKLESAMEVATQLFSGGAMGSALKVVGGKPANLLGGWDKFAGLAAVGADLLPVYTYLGTRLVAEVCLRRALDEAAGRHLPSRGVLMAPPSRGLAAGAGLFGGLLAALGLGASGLPQRLIESAGARSAPPPPMLPDGASANPFSPDFAGSVAVPTVRSSPPLPTARPREPTPSFPTANPFAPSYDGGQAAATLAQLAPSGGDTPAAAGPNPFAPLSSGGEAPTSAGPNPFAPLPSGGEAPTSAGPNPFAPLPSGGEAPASAGPNPFAPLPSGGEAPAAAGPNPFAPLPSGGEAPAAAGPNPFAPLPSASPATGRSARDNPFASPVPPAMPDPGAVPAPAAPATDAPPAPPPTVVPTWPTQELPAEQRLRGAYVAPDERWRVFSKEGVFTNHPPADARPDWDAHWAAGHTVALYTRQREHTSITYFHAEPEAWVVQPQPYGLKIDGELWRRADYDLSGRTLDGRWIGADRAVLSMYDDGRITLSGAAGRYTLGPGSAEIVWDDGTTSQWSLLSTLAPTSRRPQTLWLAGQRYTAAT